MFCPWELSIACCVKTKGKKEKGGGGGGGTKKEKKGVQKIKLNNDASRKTSRL